MKKIRFFAMIMTLLLVFSACASEAPEIIPEYDPYAKANEIDLSGYEYIIAAGTHGGGRVQLAPEPGEDSRGDKLLQRYKETEEKFNVDINVLGESNLSMFMALYATGEKYADIAICQAAEVATGKYVQNGFFQPFSDMGLDFESGIYGTQGMLDAGCFDGDYYAIISYYWGLPSPYTMPAMWFNPTLISEYQQPNPHELNEQGEWKWDAFETLCENINDVSSANSEEHVYAVSHIGEPFLELAALYSNSARIVTKGEDGILRYSLNSTNALEALEFIKGLTERKLIEENNGDFIAKFCNGRNAFVLQYTQIGLASENASGLAYNMDGPYEWTLFPTGPSYDPMTARNAYSFHSRFYFAPSNSDPEVHAIVLPYLFQPLPGETVDTWQDEFERNNFFTKESFKQYTIMRDDAFYDYAPYIPYNDLCNILSKVSTGATTATEALETMESKIQASLDNLYNDYLGK